MSKITHNLPAGYRMVITADAQSTGAYVRLSETPGGGEPGSPVAIVSSTIVTIGPFTTATRILVESTAGLLSEAISPAYLVAPTYSASQILNDSEVAGSTVADALETLGA